ncbi:M20/M25/M40 family metallo-hydrolase, partial [Chloroflexota bacterium]
AVAKMAEVINRLYKYQPKVTLIPEVKHLVQAVTELEGFDKDVNEGNVEEAIRRLSDRIFSGYLTAFTRMTVSPNVVRGGRKVNIVPDICEAEVDIRVLPGQDKEYILDELGHAIGNTIVEIIQYHAPTFSTSNSDYYRLVVDTLKESLSDAVLLPCISSGASDSRFLRESGMPCYGIGMMALNLDDNMKQSVHGKDEKIDIDSLKLKSDFLVRLARKYLGE